MKRATSHAPRRPVAGWPLATALATVICIGGALGSACTPVAGDAEHSERANAPTTPEGQRDALEQALEDARAGGSWTRAEVILETLIALDGKSATRRVALSEVRRNREIAAALDEVELLLDDGAWRTAQAWLERLKGVDMSPPDRNRADELGVLAVEIERIESDRALLPAAP